MLFKLVLLVISVVVVNLTKGEEMCKSEACLERAKEILDSMDETVNPCDNFYEFACGKFFKTENINHTQPEVSVGSKLFFKMYENLKEIMEDPELTSRYPFEFVKSMKWYYDSCVDLDGVGRSGSDEIVNLLESIDGLSFLNEFEWTGNSSIEMRAGLFANAGFHTDFLIEVEIFPYVKNTSQNIIHLSKPEDSQSENYKNCINCTITYLNGSITSDQIENIILLEKHLANLTKQTSYSENLLTIDELQAKFNYLNWTQYLSERLKIPLEGNTMVNVMDLSYLEKLDKILSNFEDKTISDYQYWKSIQMFSEFGPKELRDIMFKFTKNSLFCINKLIEEFGIGISTLYVQKYYSDNIKREFSNALFVKLRDDMKLLIDNSDSFDNETRSLFKAEFHKIQNQIGYSDFLLNPESVQTFYANLTLSGKSFLESVMELRKFQIRVTAESLLNPSPATELQIVADVNAAFHPILNTVYIQAGFLQDYIISVESPDTLNYGRIGFISSHELMHFFFNNKRTFEEDRNVACRDSTSSGQLYSKRLQCIIDQFNAFTEPNTQLKVNGNLTRDDNAADLEGLKLAYQTYKKFGVPQLLPNLNYTSDQLFWIAYGTTWCAVSDDSTMKYRIATDEHAPARFRVNGALQNIPEFAKDFDCPADSQMNPSEKCRVW